LTAPPAAAASERTIVAIAAACGAAIFAVLAMRFRGYTMDDAFITFRYATNFARGRGLVFNPVEYARAEGITSPLYAVVLSAAPALMLNVEIFAKFLGLLMGARRSRRPVVLRAERLSHYRHPAGRQSGGGRPRE